MECEKMRLRLHLLIIISYNWSLNVLETVVNPVNLDAFRFHIQKSSNSIKRERNTSETANL